MPVFTLHDVSIDLPEALATKALSTRLADGSYEADEIAAVMCRVGPGMRVLDLGAGLGVVSVLAARVAGADNVLSVEANPALLPVLRDTFDRNGQGGIRLMHGAVMQGEGGGKAAFQVPRAILGASLARSGAPEDEIVEVPSLGLESLLYDHRPELVMMDIEGAEERLFDQPWNPELRFLVLELHPPRYSDRVIKRIVDCMSDSGLTYDPATSRGRVLGFRRVRRNG
ncbi:FkbM family methyltransferase [Nioella aestuarii]|uniref:FkbM family methyltransferase n=1 Tax=Nioella aestuarii TaxID=1662864 RepID=UPI003D7FA594